MQYKMESPVVGEGEQVEIKSSGPILVVDDDKVFRTYLAELFENLGYRTEEAGPGAAVLPAPLADNPAAVVLDVELPDVSGYEVCRQLRDHYGDEIPIVFISGERIEGPAPPAGVLLRA